MRRRNIILVSFAVFLLGGWLVAPRVAVWSMALATKKGEESSRAGCDRIVFFGERAIKPTIASIEKHSPWVRSYCYLPSALEKIGGTAYADLQSAIEAHEDPKKRAYLISALQTAFEDYSHFDTVMEDFESGRLSDWGLVHMASDMRYSFPDAPELMTEERTLNPAFKAFWKQRSEQAVPPKSDRAGG